MLGTIPSTGLEWKGELVAFTESRLTSNYVPVLGNSLKITCLLPIILENYCCFFSSMPLEVSTALCSLCRFLLPGTRWTCDHLGKRPILGLGNVHIFHFYTCFVASRVFSGRAGGEGENSLQPLQKGAFFAF